LLFNNSSLEFNKSSLEMDDLYKPCDFTSINGYPHTLPEKALENLPSFQGNNAITAKAHMKAILLCVNK
jgi:hypothetical protein